MAKEEEKSASLNGSEKEDSVISDSENFIQQKKTRGKGGKGGKGGQGGKGVATKPNLRPRK